MSRDQCLAIRQSRLSRTLLALLRGGVRPQELPDHLTPDEVFDLADVPIDWTAAARPGESCAPIAAEKYYVTYKYNDPDLPLAFVHGLIFCRVCGKRSHNHDDVANFYCGKCNLFLWEEDGTAWPRRTAWELVRCAGNDTCTMLENITAKWVRQIEMVPQPDPRDDSNRYQPLDPSKNYATRFNSSAADKMQQLVHESHLRSAAQSEKLMFEAAIKGASMKDLSVAAAMARSACDGIDPSRRHRVLVRWLDCFDQKMTGAGVTSTEAIDFRLRLERELFPAVEKAPPVKPPAELEFYKQAAGDVPTAARLIREAALEKIFVQEFTCTRRQKEQDLVNALCRHMQLDCHSLMDVVEFQLKLEAELWHGAEKAPPVQPPPDLQQADEPAGLNVQSLTVVEENPASFWNMGEEYPPDSIEALLQRAKQQLHIGPFASSVATWRTGAMR